MPIKYWFLKRNRMVQKNHLNTLLDILAMMTLGHLLCIKLPQMIGYAKFFDDSKTMSFKVTDKKLLKSTPKYGKK